jgi:hypothetical protein
MTPSAQIAGGRRARRWSRETIIAKIREWDDRYGEPPCSADWNPSLARWRAQEWRVERYRDGLWPSTNAAKRPFGGSFDAAVRAAGLEPHRPGPRRRAAGAARPDFPQRAPQVARSIDDELAAADARVREAERRLRAAERRSERAEQAAGDARRRARRASERESRARRARDRVRVAERKGRELTTERVEVLTADGEARVRAAIDQAEAAAREVTDERRARQLADARAADAELRAEAAERLTRAEAGERRNGNGAALKAARAAERRAVAAERRARELAVLVRGEARRLTAAELDELRDGGPSGPAVLAAALKDLARARASGNGAGLDAALTTLASAAIRWRDRL